VRGAASTGLTCCPCPARGWLHRVVSNIAIVQDRLRGRSQENPSPTRVRRARVRRADFLIEIAPQRLHAAADVNNVHVSANNLGYRAEAVIDAVPADLITEVHLAGHSADPSLGPAADRQPRRADRPEVWSLYAPDPRIARDRR
jgi:uncharacterized protein (UPF0276 family)